MKSSDQIATPSVTSLPEAGPARILVVDDQPVNIQIVGSVLGALGHEIIPADDGPTALKRIALRPPDLILLDLLMPLMGGCEVCAQLKADPRWRDIPVIFLSAADDKELIVRALDSGGVDYLTKPFNRAELVSRVRTQLALKTARDRLQRLAEDRDELLGILAHDLKNHLGGIHMSAGLLCRQRERLHDARLVQLAENIRRTSGQSLAFLKSFLANAAADHGFDFNPGSVNLAEAVRSVAANYAEAAGQKSIQLQTDLPAEAVVAAADASALDQVLDNLISNAVKFSPPGKSVWMSVRGAAHRAEVVVRDEGPGFDAQDRERLFHRYGRLSARPTGGEPSSGLGLSIARKLVLGMGGELVCDSEPQKGATFTIRLPRVQSSEKV